MPSGVSCRQRVEGIKLLHRLPGGRTIPVVRDSVTNFQSTSDDQDTGVGRGARVLIVEDELFVAMDMEQMVEDLGAECLGTARDAAEALGLAAQTRIDLVLMDVNLGPGMSGTEAAREILALQDCRVVFVTAYRDPANLARMREVSREPILNKPVSIDKLRSILRQGSH